MGWWEAGWGPRGQPEPLDFSPDGWPGRPRGPPPTHTLIDLGGKTENLALLQAAASNQVYRSRPAWLRRRPPRLLLLSQVIRTDPRRGFGGGGAIAEEVKYEYKSSDLAGLM